MADQVPSEAYALLDDKNFAHVVTLQPDGMPQTTPVWIDRDGGVPVFNTAKGRAKHRNLVRDPRVALSVHDANNPYSYLQVRGRAELVEDGADDHIDRMAQKYLGKDTYPFRQPGEERILVRVVPEAVDWTPPRG